MLATLLYFLKTLRYLLGNRLHRRRKIADYLVLTLSGDYPQIPQPHSNPLLRYFRPARGSLLDLGVQVRRVAADPRIQGVIFHLRPLDMPLAKIDVLRGYFQQLRAAGKRVVTWSYRYGVSSYYLACAADEIVLLTGGEIAPLGISHEYLYLADALAQVGVQAEFVQISPYKTAGDMFTRNAMTEEARAMANWLAEAAWDELVRAIAAGRGWDEAAARARLNQTPLIDLQALELGFVDALLSEDDLPAHLGTAERPAHLSPWDTVERRLLRLPPQRPGKCVAIISVEGTMVNGYSQQPPIEPPLPLPVVFDTRAGDLSVTQVARRALRSKRTAAVVLYVDSRGGSATASESMAAALAKMAQRKPLVVAMGPVAASGGYYVATPGSHIFAQPNTVTGSIGVLVGKVADAGLLQKLFLNLEVISRGDAALFYDPRHPWSEAERAKIWQSIQRIYSIFLERVAESRKMETVAVDAIGGGRVWTGHQALERGLIDSIGGLDEAVTKARQLAGLPEDASLRLYFPEKTPLAPLSNPTLALRYALDGVKMLSGQALCLLPWEGI